MTYVTSGRQVVKLIVNGIVLSGRACATDDRKHQRKRTPTPV
jgi:hypothetical protein